jgi:hypothetical protein
MQPNVETGRNTSTLPIEKKKRPRKVGFLLQQLLNETTTQLKIERRFTR